MGHTDSRGSILVVDDEPTITDVVSRYLERAGYATRVAGDGLEAIRLAGAERPDLVVLDLMLPGLGGLEVMRRLRDSERMSVILLTAKGEASDRVIGLRLGADDYVVKPFSPAELVARVDAVLRRIDTAPEREQPIVRRPRDRPRRPQGDGARRGGGAHGARVRPAALFARHPGQVFSRDHLMDSVWQYSFYTDTSTVTVHIRRLRSKIEEDPSAPMRLQTVWGVAPLSSLQLLSQAIEDGLVDAETRHSYVRQMSVQVRSLSSLVEDLFELSRLEAGDIDWALHQVRVDELVEETVEAMRAQASSQGVVVQCDIPGYLAAARANPEKLQRVLFNLIQNAIRHTPADGSVTVRAQAKGAQVEVEVADTGVGIDAGEREQVFEPFFRGEQNGARSRTGAGLGLTICRAIVEAHGGQIWLAPSSEGASVRFSLPRAGVAG